MHASSLSACVCQVLFGAGWCLDRKMGVCLFSFFQSYNEGLHNYCVVSIDHNQYLKIDILF